MAFDEFLAQEIGLCHPGDLQCAVRQLAHQYNWPS